MPGNMTAKVAAVSNQCASLAPVSTRADVIYVVTLGGKVVYEGTAAQEALRISQRTKGGEIAEAHRQEIEQCLRLSDPSLSWVGQATLFLPRSNSPPQEAQSRARWLSTLPTVVQSFDACIQSKAKNWGIPNQVTRPSLQLVLFLQANLSGPARSKPDLASRPLLSLQEGRVQLFYEAGFLSAPKLIAGKDPKYTGAGLLENVQGTIVAKCIIDTKGRVRNCRALKKLSRMNDATF